MRRLSRLITYGVILLVLGVAVIALWGRVGRRQVGQRFHTYVMMRDASALPIGSRVMVAGVQVGEISRLAIQGDLARVDMVLRDDLVLWDDAAAEKRSASRFGDAYIELRPGGPEHPDAGDEGRRRLRSGQPIPHVIEAASTDRVLRAIDQAMPRVQQVLEGANTVLRDARRWMGGRARSRLEEIDRWIASGNAVQPLTTADEAMTRLDAWTLRVADATSGAADTINPRLDQFATDVADVTTTMRNARTDLGSGLGEFRTDLDVVDEWVDEANETLETWGAGPSPDSGQPAGARRERNRFGELVANGDLGARIDEVTEAGADFTAGLGRLKTWVGLRAEYNVLSGGQRFYLTAEIYGRSDNFYLVELEKGPLGGRPEVELSDGLGSDSFTRNAVIREELRFTAQWGKRLGWLQVRFGLKESSFGVGADAVLLGGRLRFETDVFELTGYRVPRVKVAAALRLFESLYVLGGVDDALLAGADLPIAPWPDGADVPIQFEELRYGRDYFLGMTLRFDERDINSLLLLYGAVLGAIL